MFNSIFSFFENKNEVSCFTSLITILLVLVNTYLVWTIVHNGIPPNLIKYVNDDVYQVNALMFMMTLIVTVATSYSYTEKTHKELVISLNKALVILVFGLFSIVCWRDTYLINSKINSEMEKHILKLENEINLIKNKIGSM